MAAQEVPSGYDPELDAEPKTKSARRNARKREKRLQVRLAEAQVQKTLSQDLKPEQLDKLSKLEGWREELKLLDNEKAEVGKSWNV